MSYPFQLEEISRWVRIKQAALKTAGVDCSIDESPSEASKPAVFGDFFARDAAGRITGWVSGEFHFEVIHTCGDSRRWFRHVDVTALEELEPVFADFDRRLRSLTEADSGAGNT